MRTTIRVKLYRCFGNDTTVGPIVTPWLKEANGTRRGRLRIIRSKSYVAPVFDCGSDEAGPDRRSRYS